MRMHTGLWYALLTYLSDDFSPKRYKNTSCVNSCPACKKPSHHAHRRHREKQLEYLEAQLFGSHAPNLPNGLLIERGMLPRQRLLWVDSLQVRLPSRPSGRIQLPTAKDAVFQIHAHVRLVQTVLFARQDGARGCTSQPICSKSKSASRAAQDPRAARFGTF